MMGFIKPGLGELVIILVIVLVLFGAKRLPQIGSAIGEAIRGFRKSMKDLDGTDSHDKDDRNTTDKK